MGRWRAVGEIQVRALQPEGYEDTGSLISALMRVARPGPRVWKDAATLSLLPDRSPVPPRVV